jgi:hypothetical protein
MRDSGGKALLQVVSWRTLDERIVALRNSPLHSGTDIPPTLPRAALFPE